MSTSYFSGNNKTFVCTLLLLGVFYSTLISAQNIQLDKGQQIDSVAVYISTGKSDSLSNTKRLDALLKGVQYAEKIKVATEKSKAFSRLSLALYQHGDSLLFRQTNRTAVALSKQVKDSITLAEAYWDLGAFYHRISVRDSAYYTYSQAQQLYEAKKNPSLSGRMFLGMAFQQEAVKDYVGSEANTILAIQRLKPINDFKRLYTCYNLLGIVTKDLENYDKAIEHYNEAVFYAKKLDDNKNELLFIKNNLGVVYQSKKDFARAIDNFEAILSADSIKIKNAQLYSIVLNNLAFSKIQLKDTFEVKNLIEESIRIKDSLGLHSSTAMCYMSLSEYYWFKNDTVASISAASKSRAISLESSNNEQLLETLEFLTKIDVKNASKHALAYYTLNHRLQKEERQTRNKFARIRFETDEFIAENEVLSEEKEVLSRQNQIWAAVAVGFFILGIALYVIVNQRSKNQKLVFQQQQQVNNQEIFNLMLAQKQKVDEVKRMEQKRISEELHDGILGKMLGARMVLTGLNKKTDTEAIQERSGAIVALKNIESELRSISHELSYAAYQKINNFGNSIESLLESVKDKPMNTIFNYNEDVDWDRLLGDIKISVYRIIQENLQNAIKHSSCSNFFVNFEIDSDIFLVTIGDDGKGFVFDKQRRGIGIRNIKSRVKKMDGTWTIDTAQNKGTVMKLSIPAQFSATPNSDVLENNELGIN
jgi:two-component system NarL family sensor kinase